MEVVVPMACTSPDFYFSKTTTPSPNQSAPSSPKPFGNPNDFYYACYTSAPASPTRASSIYSYYANDVNDDDFDFSSSLEVINQEDLSTADELFDKGQIRPLTKPRGSWSPRGGSSGKAGDETINSLFSAERGRAAAKSRSKREPRSLSPSSTAKTPNSSSSTSTCAAPAIKSSGSRKWRLKDLFLFRSASEGRATERGSKDPLRKYTLLSSFSSSSFSKDETKVKSLKSMESSSSVKLHYAANRAASEQQKKKTPLPYHRNTLFGCLHFNPALKSITRGFGNGSKNV